jgi:hypothetical protein
MLLPQTANLLREAMTLSLVLSVVLLVHSSPHASASDPSLTRSLISDSRLLKRAPVFCRCEAAFEQLYRDENANNRMLVERELKLYNYEDSYMDSKGYYIVDVPNTTRSSGFHATSENESKRSRRTVQ